MELTTQQKYDWLLSKLELQDVDLWEKDAMIGLPERLYLQFSEESDIFSMDNCVKLAIETE